MLFNRKLRFILLITSAIGTYIYFNIYINETTQKNVIKQNNENGKKVPKEFDNRTTQKNVIKQNNENGKNTTQVPLMLLVSFDGFRWDYFQIHKNLKNFDYLRRIGSHADYVETSDPTLTYPNHYSIVTGLYPESHGIVSNDMYDKLLNKVFHFDSMKTQTDDWYKQNPAAEPIWISNLKAGDDRTSASQWIGSIAYQNTKSHIYIPIDHENPRPYKTDINELIELYKRQKQPINFGTLYFGEPDKIGHEYGPYSKEMGDKLLYLDSIVGYLIEKLKNNGLFDRMNLILTSDHGMAEISSERVVYLDDYIDSKLFKKFNVYGTSLATTLYLKEDFTEKYIDVVYNALKNIKHISVYKRDSIPERFHLRNNIRSGDLFIFADIGYVLLIRWRTDVKKYWSMMRGDHGYIGGHSSMYPFFISAGPAFKKNYKIKNFKNVDIYPLMCHILGVEPAPNNGSLKRTIDMIRDSSAV